MDGAGPLGYTSNRMTSPRGSEQRGGVRHVANTLVTLASLAAVAERGLAAGRQRPVLVVMSYDPPPGGPSGIEVTSPATGATTRIGLFPDGAFAASDAKNARRYFLPSIGGDRAVTECFSVKLRAAEGGAATVMLEISPPLAN